MSTNVEMVIELKELLLALTEANYYQSQPLEHAEAVDFASDLMLKIAHANPGLEYNKVVFYAFYLIRSDRADTEDFSLEFLHDCAAGQIGEETGDELDINFTLTYEYTELFSSDSE